MRASGRREFLVRSAATVAAAGPFLSVGALPGCAPSRTEQISDFVQLSSALLGIAAGALAPQPDPADVKSQIFDAAAASDAQALDELIGIARAHRGDSAAVVDAVFASGGADLARSILLAWLLGTWYEPRALAGASAPQGKVLSADAYRGAWVWRVAQTHPMGASDVGFGSWSSPPQPLEHFVGGG